MTTSGAGRSSAKAVLLCWLAFAVVLAILFYRVADRQVFYDPDDQLRLLQVRNFLGGQSWFDLTQYRINPPHGLAMHWSRVVDIPVLLFLAPLAPLIGRHAAETAALIGAPLLNMLVLFLAVAALVRRLLPGKDEVVPFACIFAISAPAVFAQIHPARIDHHGWQIALAAVTVAALMDRRRAASGIVAGFAIALFLAISIEGLPFAIVTIGAVGILWVSGIEDEVRFARLVQSTAVSSLVINPLVAPSARWVEPYCDAVMPAHLAALGTGALAASLAIVVGRGRSWRWRAAVLAVAALVSLAAMLAVAPQCVGSPFGTMDPLVRRMWYGNIVEGLPFWRQPPLDAMTMIVFPIVALMGTVIALRGAPDDAARRAWAVMLLILIGTTITGALVRRAAGVSHVAASPGAAVLVAMVLSKSADWQSLPKRVAFRVGALLLLSPIGLIYAARPLVHNVQTEEPSAWHVADAETCDVDCALPRLDRLPAVTMISEFGIAPNLIAKTHHSAYAAGYHRLQGPIADTLRFFSGSAPAARRFMTAKGLRFVLIGRESTEVGVYRRENPVGFAAQLADGKPPSWLRRVEFGGGNSLLLYQVVDR